METRYIPIPRSRPRWTHIIAGVNSLIFLGALIVGQDVALSLGAKINRAIVYGEWWRLLTAIFLHADLLHLGFNTYALLVFGSQVEQVYGPWRFLLSYLTAGVAGSALSFLLNPHPSVGASGAIFGLIGMEGAYLYRYRHHMLSGRAALGNILFIVAYNLIYGLANPQVDNWGHIGGLLAGLALGWFLAPLYVVVQPDPFLPPQVTELRSPRRWLIGIALVGAGILLALIGGILRWG